MRACVRHANAMATKGDVELASHRHNWKKNTTENHNAQLVRHRHAFSSKKKKT